MSDLKKIKKTVMVDICQTQSINGYDPLEVEEEALGSLYQVDQDTYILAFDTLLNDKKVTTTVKVANNTLSIVRIGDVHSRQTFAVNEWYASQYFYGGCSLVCRNFTKKLDYALTTEGGIIEVLYELWSGDTHLGYFNLEMFIR
ncbi:MAG: DUF1934 domain-containing protein [Candidatus Melainabacteria bacterium]